MDDMFIYTFTLNPTGDAMIDANQKINRPEGKKNLLDRIGNLSDGIDAFADRKLDVLVKKDFSAVLLGAVGILLAYAAVILIAYSPGKPKAGKAKEPAPAVVPEKKAGAAGVNYYIMTNPKTGLAYARMQAAPKDSIRTIVTDTIQEKKEDKYFRYIDRHRLKFPAKLPGRQPGKMLAFVKMPNKIC